ncbi:HSP20-like chaperone [Nitzschia inconspicua]|uniref:CS domain containing protein n=1 Tax=Nitzschia inconspicua TaxID=303405 RepID=A0A9K3KCM1_9STRA|nr:CS domain containing protein [Nitzschia inconspicua]KAG7341290.1 HSP20-like chaperone [Nitzschia inconspicua]
MTLNDDDNRNKNQDDDEEDNMTPEERLQWLRDRGVVVETPEERKEAAVISTKTATTISTNDTTTPSKDAITYVYIPADQAKPLEERYFVPPPPPPMAASSSATTSHLLVDPLVEFLKPAFAGNADQVDLNLFRKQQSDNPVHQLASSSSSLSTSSGAMDALPSVSDDTLRSVAQQGGHVETFSLVHPTANNQHTAVTFYLDEIGQLKRLPLNGRASDLAKAAGYNPPPIFYGDVFVAKQQQQQQRRSYLSMTVADCHVQAPWLQQAAMDNLEHQLQMNRMTGRSGDERQPTVVGSDGVAQKEDGYSWTQSEEEIELVVPLPETTTGTTSKNDVSVIFKPKRVQVQVKNTSFPTILSIDLFERVDVDGCTWTVENGKGDKNNNHNLVVTLEKADEALWPRLET